MVDSIGSNNTSKYALQNLNKSATQLKRTHNRVSSGLKVGGAKDNAAAYNIAQKLRSNTAGLSAAKSSIDRAISVTDIGASVAQDVSDSLLDLRELAVRASDSGLDVESRQALNNEFVELRDSIDTLVSNASFNGTNVVAGDDVTALVNEDGSQVVTLTGEDLTTGGATVTVSATDSISTTTNAKATLTLIDASISNVGQALSRLGSGSRGLEQNRVFADTLSDTIEVGIGKIVDADLARESASLQAGKVKEQLGLQTLAISNQAPRAVLSLFV